MGKLKWDVGKGAADAVAEEFEYYDGPKPAKGVYRFELARLRAKPNRNDDTMLNYMLRLNETDRLKKKFNGYVLWGQQNVTKQGAPYVNQFLIALGLTKPQIKSFWDDGCLTDSEDPPNILRLGRTFKVKEGLPIYAQIKPDPYEGDADKMGVAQFVVPKNKPAASEDEDDSDEDSAPEFDEKARKKELKGLDLPSLQAAAKAAGVKGAKKQTDVRLLIQATVDAEREAAEEPGHGDPF